ncbi:DUF4113 domain-containing protein [Halomonas sp. N3-2A]|uniref:DUF4113 domain-containing protein n=1 Tax=Halomonas sp. N3-2A TaxID=2014541 RepID=UPI00406D2138
MLLDLSPKANRQLTLTETPHTEAGATRSERLMATVDKLNRELGRGTIQLGLPQAGNAWTLRSELHHALGGVARYAVDRHHDNHPPLRTDSKSA